MNFAHLLFEQRKDTRVRFRLKEFGSKDGARCVLGFPETRLDRLSSQKRIGSRKATLKIPNRIRTSVKGGRCPRRAVCPAPPPVQQSHSESISHFGEFRGPGKNTIVARSDRKQI